MATENTFHKFCHHHYSFNCIRPRANKPAPNSTKLNKMRISGSCQTAGQPAPRTKTSRLTSMKYRAGTTIEKRLSGNGILSIGYTKPESKRQGKNPAVEVA